MKTPEEFKEQAELKGITYWPSHDCSICGVSVGTEIRDGQASYRSGVKMQMSLTLDNSAAVKMVAILQDEITKSAQNLSDILVKSMPIQIEEKTKSETEE